MYETIYSALLLMLFATLVIFFMLYCIGTITGLMKPWPFHIKFTKEVFTHNKASQLKTCGNCERTIGKLEKHRDYKDNVVCVECHELLKKQELT